MEAAEELRELRALVERAGGRRAVLLVAEVAEGAPVASTLASFARDLLGDEAPPVPAPTPGCPSRSRCRSRGEGGRRVLSAGLLLVLCRGGAARGRGNRARLREVVRDVRGRLPPGSPPAAVVGVLLPGGDGEDAAVLDATLRRHFPAPGTVQGARYSPGSPAALRECRAAACRALRAALQHPAGFRFPHIVPAARIPSGDLPDASAPSSSALVGQQLQRQKTIPACHLFFTFALLAFASELTSLPASVPLPHPAHHCPAQESHPGAEPLAGKVPGSAHCVVELGWEQQRSSRASGLSRNEPEEEKERERWRLPAFLPCASWSRRSRRKGHVSKDANNVHEADQQDPQEVALTSLSPNGNYEEAAGGAGT